MKLKTEANAAVIVKMQQHIELHKLNRIKFTSMPNERPGSGIANSPKTLFFVHSFSVRHHALLYLFHIMFGVLEILPSLARTSINEAHSFSIVLWMEYGR